MIRENELRVGNYFFIGGLDRYVKVSSVFLSHFKCTDENGIDFNNHQYNIKPIELTEEILLKCGFEKKDLVFEVNDYLVIGIELDFIECLDEETCDNKYYEELKSLEGEEFYTRLEQIVNEVTKEIEIIGNIHENK